MTISELINDVNKRLEASEIFKTVVENEVHFIEYMSSTMEKIFALQNLKDKYYFNRGQLLGIIETIKREFDRTDPQIQQKVIPIIRSIENNLEDCNNLIQDAEMNAKNWIIDEQKTDWTRIAITIGTGVATAILVSMFTD